MKVLQLIQGTSTYKHQVKEKERVIDLQKLTKMHHLWQFFYHFSFVETELSEKSNSYTQAKRKDILWVISFNLFNSVPMWTRLNTRRSESNTAKQPVCYRKPIQLSPVRTDVIKETVHRSHIVAEGCGQDYALVTYDLTTAKIARRI